MLYYGGSQRPSGIAEGYASLKSRRKFCVSIVWNTMHPGVKSVSKSKRYRVAHLRFLKF